MPISPSAHDNSAPVEASLLGLFPETLPPDERVSGVLKNSVQPEVVGWSVISFLQETTLRKHWNRSDTEQALWLQQMVTKAICGEYGDWPAFQRDLRLYLEKFGFAKFPDDADCPVVAQAESENPCA